MIPFLCCERYIEFHSSSGETFEANNFKQMYKLKNLIGHQQQQQQQKSRARTKVSRIPLNFFLLYYVDIDWNVLRCDIYCNLLVVVRLLWNNFTAETERKRTKEAGNLCLMLVHYVARCISSRDSEYCFMDLNTSKAFDDESEERAHEINCNRRFAIFVGSVMSDKTKELLTLLATMPSCVLMPSVDIFRVIAAFKLSPRHIISIGVDDLQRKRSKNSIANHIGISNKL